MKSDRPVLRVKAPTETSTMTKMQRTVTQADGKILHRDEIEVVAPAPFSPDSLPPPPLGTLLARRVKASDLYYTLAAEERAECDELLRLGGDA
jgi:hypothetical protein